MTTLGKIAHGIGDNLITRCARWRSKSAANSSFACANPPFRPSIWKTPTSSPRPGRSSCPSRRGFTKNPLPCRTSSTGSSIRCAGSSGCPPKPVGAPKNWNKSSPHGPRRSPGATSPPGRELANCGGSAAKSTPVSK
ncbi:MAG: hypothetical protein IPN23_02860 [Elusimicrobia bacterium]|nr:hypothetical protein [Elusimicrobiota bacterium]